MMTRCHPSRSSPLPLLPLAPCSTMSAAFCAFSFSPAALPLPQLEAVVRVMANLFRRAGGNAALQAINVQSLVLSSLAASRLAGPA